MTDKERLVELIIDAENAILREYPYTTDAHRIERVADYLLANSVIIPPCKVGDTVYKCFDCVEYSKCGNCEHFRINEDYDCIYCARTESSQKAADCTEIKKIIVATCDLYDWLYSGAFNNYIFQTREEAEKALAERSAIYETQ